MSRIFIGLDIENGEVTMCDGRNTEHWIWNEHKLGNIKGHPVYEEALKTYRESEELHHRIYPFPTTCPYAGMDCGKLLTSDDKEIERIMALYEAEKEKNPGWILFGGVLIPIKYPCGLYEMKHSSQGSRPRRRM